MRTRGCYHRAWLPSPALVFEDHGFQLAGRGVWRSALCPFHEDSRPSLRVNVESGAFRCMACGAAGGDVVDFVRKYRGLSFVETVQLLGAWG